MHGFRTELSFYSWNVLVQRWNVLRLKSGLDLVLNFPENSIFHKWASRHLKQFMAKKSNVNFYEILKMPLSCSFSCRSAELEGRRHFHSYTVRQPPRQLYLRGHLLRGIFGWDWPGSHTSWRLFHWEVLSTLAYYSRLPAIW